MPNQPNMQSQKLDQVKTSHKPENYPEDSKPLIFPIKSDAHGNVKDSIGQIQSAEPQKEAVVATPNTSAQPSAVVVKASHTVIAHVAVAGTLGPEDVARFAVFHSFESFSISLLIKDAVSFGPDSVVAAWKGGTHWRRDVQGGYYSWLRESAQQNKRRCYALKANTENKEHDRALQEVIIGTKTYLKHRGVYQDHRHIQ